MDASCVHDLLYAMFCNISRSERSTLFDVEASDRVGCVTCLANLCHPIIAHPDCSCNKVVAKISPVLGVCYREGCHAQLDKAVDGGAMTRGCSQASLGLRNSLSNSRQSRRPHLQILLNAKVKTAVLGAYLQPQWHVESLIRPGLSVAPIGNGPRW